MNNTNLFKASGYGILVLLIIATILKLTNNPVADDLLVVAVTGYFIFMAVVLYQILTSRNIGTGEKLAWIVGLVCLFIFTGFYYLISGHRRVAMKTT